MYSSSVGQERTMGLFINESEAFNGYTLFSNNEFTYLIDNCGIAVQAWESQYKPGQGLYLLSNGDLLRSGSISGAFNAGGRGGVFQLIDWDGGVKWEYTIADNNRHAHHDLAPMPNGNFLCVVWEKKSESEARGQGRRYGGDVWSERILEIEVLDNNRANIVWEWSIWDHLIQDFDSNRSNFGSVSDHPELLDINYIGPGEENFGDWLHINSISYNAELDQIVISSRNLSEIYVIDHSTTTTEAASHSGGRYGRGGDILYRYGNPQVYKHGSESDQVLRRQHQIDWVVDDSGWPGRLSVFNNEYIEGRQSSVLIFNNPIDDVGGYSFDPIERFGEDTIVRLYTDPSLYSDILSGVQVLPNDNLLIVEGEQGHVFEIDGKDRIIWKYINPVNSNGGPGIQGGTPRFNALFRAIRYGPDYPGLVDKDLNGLDPVERSPIESDCQLFEIVSSYEDEDIGTAAPVKLLYNLIHNNLMVEFKGFEKTKAIIFNSLGLKVKEFHLQNGVNEFIIGDIPSDVYIFFTPYLSERFVKF